MTFANNDQLLKAQTGAADSDTYNNNYPVIIQCVVISIQGKNKIW